MLVSLALNSEINTINISAWAKRKIRQIAQKFRVCRRYLIIKMIFLGGEMVLAIYKRYKIILIHL